MEGPLVAADEAIQTDLSDAQLFNLADDIGEKNNLAAAQPQKAKELAEEWLRWNKELAKPLWKPAATVK